MIRYYKRYFVIGMTAFVLAFSISFLEDTGKSFQYYYGVLYSNASFVLYLVLFLFGMIPIASGLFTPELAIRYGSKMNIILCRYKKLWGYGIFFGGLFLGIHLVITLSFCAGTYFTSLHYYVFLLTAFLFHMIGWICIGSMFLMLYSLLRNGIFAYLLVGLIMVVLMSIDHIGNFTYFINPRKMMFSFFEISGAVNLTLVLISYLLASGLFLFMEYQLLKKGDLLQPMKGGE